MTPKPTPTNSSLDDALYALSLQCESLDAAVLDDFVRRYPQYGKEITDLAIELAVDALRFGPEPASDGPATDADAWSPAVERAMSRFQNRLYSETHSKSERSPLGASSAANPFLELGRQQFRELADRLHANVVLVAKLRDRQILPDTVPESFCQAVADELSVPLDLLQAHLAAPQQALRSPQFFKAEEKPRGDLRESYSDAVRSSGLSEEQQRRLLSL